MITSRCEALIVLSYDSDILGKTINLCNGFRRGRTIVYQDNLFGRKILITRTVYGLPQKIRPNIIARYNY